MKKIAIIGSGVSGAEAAYQLTKNTRSEIIVEVFEKEPTAGGRAHTIEFAGNQIEVGGTVVHSSNLLVKELMDFAGAQEDTETPLVGKDSDHFWFWNGKQVYLDVRNSTLSFASNLIKSYGPFSTWNFRSNAVNAVNRWKRVYELTQQRDFNNPFDLIQSLKLETETETSLIELFRKRHVSDKLTENFCGAIIQNMYLQNQTINAFAGEVGLAGAGLVGGHLFGIRGGNGNMFGQVLAKIAAAGKAKVHYNTAVTAVADTSVVLKDGSKVEFDAVVIATPLELAGIKILVGNSQLKLQEREYKPVHVTLVAGELDLNYFHSNSSTPPASVFVKANQGLAYKSIGHTGFTTDGTKIYKFFSDQPLPEPLLDQLFSKRIDQTEHHWNGAYPVLKPKNLWPDYQLAPKVFYCNGLETAAASLETNAVSAFNVANLCKVRLTALK